MICWKCKKSENLPLKPGRLDTCPHCNSFLHCCYSCKYYDPAAHNECREPQAEWVKDKNLANFCGYFTVGVISADESAQQEKFLSKEEAEKKWAQLFKKK